MIFLTKDQVLRMHKANIEEFGGAHGLREKGAFESALEAAENRAYYEGADAIGCAVAYGFHLCQAHASIDGNKRVAGAAMLIFLDLNGVNHSITVGDVIEIFLKIASSKMTRDELEALVRSRVARIAFDAPTLFLLKFSGLLQGKELKTMFAIIRVGGKQYRVQDGTQLLVDRLASEEGATFEGAEVLMLEDGENVTVGAPLVAGATVAATVVRHSKGKKIRVFKYKAKKNYRRRIGARAHQTLLRIDSITA